MKDPPLAALQAALQAYLLGRQDAVPAQVNDSARTDARALLDVYRDGYALRLIEVLKKDFPKLLTMLGDDRFAAMGRAYLAAHPPSSFSVRWFGRRLAAFLAAATPWSEHGSLAEMAAFEWALGEAFDAPDAAVIGPEALAAVPHAGWPGLTFTLHPSLRRLAFRHDVPSLWQALELGEAPEAPPPREARATDHAIWRRGLEPAYRAIEPDEAWALDAAADGMAFGPLCDGLTRFHEVELAAGRAAGLLKQWLVDGLIVAYALTPESST
jgi:hypothetical protein